MYQKEIAMELSTDHPQVHDDTQEVNDRQTRRKIQNRLNQRASRRRKALLSSKSSRTCPRKWVFYTASSPETGKNPAPSGILAQHETNACAVYFCRLSLESRQVILDVLEDRVNRAAITRSLSSELLLPVTRWNIIRAMYTNAAMMGLTMTLLAEDIISPFNICGPTTSNLPPALQPTRLQKSIIHHPWIDLWAVPSVRDTLLRNFQHYSDDELCHDLFGGSSDCNQPTGLVIWSEAWEEFGYEISESVFRKWEWLWKERPQLLQSTNYWRSQRGEEALVIAA